VWIWFVVCYAVFVATLIGYAAHIALSGQDQQHRADGFRVLKLVLASGTGTGGVVAVAIRLNELGVL
jgi:hypothetical protein